MGFLSPLGARTQHRASLRGSLCLRNERFGQEPHLHKCSLSTPFHLRTTTFSISTPFCIDGNKSHLLPMPHLLCSSRACEVNLRGPNLLDINNNTCFKWAYQFVLLKSTRCSREATLVPMCSYSYHCWRQRDDSMCLDLRNISIQHLLWVEVGC